MTPNKPKTLYQAIAEFEEAYLRNALAELKGDASKLAIIAAVSLATIYRRMDRYNILPKGQRKEYRLSLVPQMRASTLLEFFGVQPLRGHGDFWSVNQGYLDVYAHDAHRNYLAMVRKLHPDAKGNPATAKRLAQINDAWATLRTALRDHGADC